MQNKEDGVGGTENRAAAAGLRTGDLPRLLNASLLGAHAGTVQEGSTEIDVTVRLDNEFRDQANDLGALPVIGAGGMMVPLEQLGRWVLKPGASAIERYQGERVVTVQAFLHPYTLPDTALSEFQRLLAAVLDGVYFAQHLPQVLELPQQGGPALFDALQQLP